MKVCPNHQDQPTTLITGITGERWCGECGIPEHDFITPPLHSVILL
jgi:hypothetical protein